MIVLFDELSAGASRHPRTATGRDGETVRATHAPAVLLPDAAGASFSGAPDMARRPRAARATPKPEDQEAPAAGGNSNVSPDTYFLHRRALQLAKRELDAAQGVYRAKLKAAKSAGLNQGALIRVLQALKGDTDEVVANEKTFARYMAFEGIQVGDQPDMLAPIEGPGEKTKADLGEWEAEDRGYAAGKAGGDISANPYQPGTPHYAQWDKGFRDGMLAIAPLQAEGVLVKSTAGQRVAGAPGERFN